MKTCSTCHIEKSESDFYKNSGKKDGIHNECKLCDKVRDYKRRRGFTLHKQCLVHLGGVCKRCGFDDWRALQIDHVNGGGKKELQSKKYYNWRLYYRNVLSDTTGKYQVLCANCNWIKKNENGEGVRVKSGYAPSTE